MLTRPAPSSPYLKANGSIDMSHVFCEAHRRAKATRARQSMETVPAGWTHVVEAYAAIFKRMLTDELFRAKAAKLERARDLGLFREPVLTSTVSSFGGQKFRDDFADGRLIHSTTI